MTSTAFRWIFAVALTVAVAWVLLTLPAGAEWPQDAFSCKTYRRDLVWRDWAREHCGRRWRHRDYYHKPAPNPDIMSAQLRLQQLGYELDADGFVGPETRDALLRFQVENELKATGELDRATKYALNETKGYDAKDRSQCLAEPLHVWSGQHNTESVSKGDAQKRWMLGVQAKFGSIWMNFTNATSVRWRCFQSQSHDTFLGKVQSGTSKILGGEGYFVVCELWARPCSAPMEKAEED